MEIDSPVRAPSSEATIMCTPLNRTSSATGPLRQQSSPADLNIQSQPADKKFEQCLLKLLDSAAAAPTNWKIVARQLGVEETPIQQIAAENHQNTKEAFYQVMLYWRCKEGKEATPQKLITALTEMKLKKVIEDYEKYLDW